MIAELAVDLAAIRANVERLRALVRPARFAAVVKANAYGHGLVPVAHAIAGAVDAFCVYRLDEARTLRDARIDAPVLIVGPVESGELDDALALDVAIPLWDEGGFVRDVARAARNTGRRFPVHAKIDTGVTRLGLDAERAGAAIASYLRDDALDVRGVYTHLAAVEELESAFTLGQMERFERALENVAAPLRERGAIRHVAASAAAMLFPALRLDMVRTGIALYGIWPSEATRAAVAGAIELEPALTWTTTLVTVRDVNAGRAVGYGCTFHTSRPSRIAVIPIGYAEGVPRAWSNAGVALVAGRRVPFVGRVCMNMAFLDVTGVPGAQPGARVTLLGRDGAERIDPNEAAANAGTIGYELVARLPLDLPRRFVETASLQTNEPASTLT